MKDSFIFEGKKYISSRRASAISDYASDYIGQLCRANKLDCRMIGRSWFVTEESLHLHKANISREEALRGRIENLKGGKREVLTPAFVSGSATTVSVTAIPSTEQSTPVAQSVIDSSSTSNYSQPSVVAPAKPIVPVSTAWTLPVEKVTGIASPYVYSSDDRPLLPVLKNQNVSDIKSNVNVSNTKLVSNDTSIIDSSELARKVEIRKVESMKIAKSSNGVGAGVPVTSYMKVRQTSAPVKVKSTRRFISYPELTRSIILRRVIAPLAVIVMFFSVGTGVYIGAEKAISSITPEVYGTAKVVTANISDAVGSAWGSLKGGYKSVVAFFTSPAKLAMEVPKEFGDVTVSEVTPNGIVLTSSTGSEVGDEVMKQKIAGSFSDEVEINPDNSGTAGVITPVFKDAKGKDFIYVMVPVKDKTASVMP